MGVTVVVGTEKGAWILRSDKRRRDWKVEGPIFKGWKVTAIARDRHGKWLAGVASFVYGATIQSSTDLVHWTQAPEGPSYPEGGRRKLKQIWRIHTEGPAYLAGVDEAGVFASEDGQSWTPIKGLNEHPTSEAWYPGNGGLCAHALLVDPKNPKRAWCGISAVGVFRTDDGGATWTPKNQGVPVILEDKVHKDIGYCVHGLVADPQNADVIYRQDHLGMFRTRNGGDQWEKIENGLPSRFGFPIAIDRTTRTLFSMPLESDEYRIPCGGQLRVYRSRNGGDSWEPLPPSAPGEWYVSVLRGALVTDTLSPCGVYFGTTGGTVHMSPDGGETWAQAPVTLPRILCVGAFAE